jgi:hypothetical protein
MNLKNYKPILEVFVISIIALSIHKLIFYLFKVKFPEQLFYYTLQNLYLFFFCSSTILLFILIKVKQTNIDNVGYTFLLLTSIKMGISFAVLSPILNLGSKTMNLEKMNFFIIFLVFLITETIVTIRLLNNNQ